MRLKNKIALITGSARGIGQATAERFHEEGATVIVSDILDEQGKEVVSKLGARSEYIHLDVKQENEWKSISEYLSREYHRLVILVNNAGITGFLETKGPHDAEHIDIKTWEEVHRVNATGTMLGCKNAIPLIKNQGGSIINISSRRLIKTSL